MLSKHFLSPTPHQEEEEDQEDASSRHHGGVKTNPGYMSIQRKPLFPFLRKLPPVFCLQGYEDEEDDEGEGGGRGRRRPAGEKLWRLFFFDEMAMVVATDIVGAMCSSYFVAEIRSICSFLALRPTTTSSTNLSTLQD